ncbi:hypothetical protein RRG08_012335 [Elysia crispata]|uniref:Uncharacterized protein n=1 Tax=Elysia crispata TaxID=231223 RepID=A0AAE1BAQ7_9GAST|nr:hypothetical protein RRG08_012335 [Elysia crispata]
MMVPQPMLSFMVLLALMSHIITTYSTEIEQRLKVSINNEIKESHLQSVCDGRNENGMEVEYFYVHENS